MLITRASTITRAQFILVLKYVLVLITCNSPRALSPPSTITISTIMLINLLPFFTLPALALSAAVKGPQTFTLHAPYPAAAPLPSSGGISWLGAGIQAIGGPLGWWDSDATHTPLTLFIQYNKKEGIAFDATKTSRTMYLRAERRDGLREVQLGSPRVTSSFHTDDGSGTNEGTA